MRADEGAGSLHGIDDFGFLQELQRLTHRGAADVVDAAQIPLCGQRRVFGYIPFFMSDRILLYTSTYKAESDIPVPLALLFQA